MKYVRHDDRVEKILEVSRQMLFESGSESLAMTEIASQCGITTAWLYRFFHNVDEILDAIYDRSFASIAVVSEEQRRISADVLNHGVNRFDALLSLPPQLYGELYGAFFATPSARPALLRLQQRLKDNVENNWVAPMVKVDIPKRIAVANAHVFLGTAFILANMVKSGELELSDARLQFESLIRALTKVHQNAPA